MQALDWTRKVLGSPSDNLLDPPVFQPPSMLKSSVENLRYSQQGLPLADKFRSHIYRFCDLNTILHKLSVLSKSDRELLLDQCDQDQDISTTGVSYLHKDCIKITVDKETPPMLYAIAMANEIEIQIKNENQEVIQNILQSGKKISKLISNVNTSLFKSVKDVTVTDPNSKLNFTKD